MRHYGDERERTEATEDHLVRIITQNINTFPKMGTLKQDRMKHEMKMNTVIGMSELNTNWAKIPAAESFHNRTRHWWTRPKTQTAWLYDPEWPNQHQKGGVALTVQAHLSPYVQTKGKDESGLGRWAWITLESRSETKTVIIQIYRPCRNSTDLGSVYNQQKAWTEQQDPVATFDKDLIETIDNFRRSGHQIIVMGDFNNPPGQKETRSIEKELAERDIINHITQRYGEGLAPNTQARGSHPIDAIYCSRSIDMIRGGFDKGMDEISDHRAVWMDITMDTLLGVDRGVFQKPINRKLQVKNKKVTDRFNRAFERQIIKHKMIEKAEKLMEIARKNKKLTKQEKQTLEGIDEQRCRAVEYANQRCSKLPSDDADFSPTLQEAIGIATIHAEMLKKMRTKGRIHKRWIQRMRERWEIKQHIPIPANEEEAVEGRTRTREALKEIKRRAPELRRDFLEMLINQAEDEGDREKAKELRVIRDREEIKEVHTRVKLAQGKLKGGGVKFVERHNQDGTKTTIKDKREMEKEIIKANEEKLHSADESPIRRGEISKILTDHDYERWEEFLDGRLQLPENMEEGTRRWLKKVLETPTVERPMEITEQEYVQSWAKPREHAACAPGPMHYGTFKAMKWSPKATKLHTIMANIPVLTGYIPKRWTQCVDSMLPKKKDEWRPAKLRLTALLMPDFNHNNKILGRRAMRNAEEDGTMAEEQYGSRKHHSAPKHALNKRLVMDILRAQRRPAVVCANDAKACYDRILHFAAYISLRKAGLTKQATISMLEPIRRLTHRIRTAYGDSKLSYGGDQWARDPSGICQGNGAGPTIWALVSSPLLKMLREAGYGAKLHASIGDTFIHMCGFAFVDDADTIQTGKLTDTPTEVLKEAQAQLKLWEEGIRATGGGIEGSKSDFVVVGFQWKGGVWKYTPMQHSHKLWVPDGKGGREYLTQIPYNKARRTLGVWQAADGNENTQTAKMKEKAMQWSRKTKAGFLSRHDVVFGIKTSLYPSLTYGLMATALDKQQAEEVFKPVRKYAISQMGYNMNMPKEVVHGPRRYGGMGLRDIYTVQGTEHIKVLLDEMTSQSPTGKLLRILHQEHQLEIGRSTMIYEIPYKEIEGFLTPSWVTNTLEFVDKVGLRIEGELPELQGWREGDAHLMDVFRKTPGHAILEEDLVAANKCRMYIRAVTQSDIADGEGKSILKAAWEVKREWQPTSGECYKWPRQERPPKADIRKWQKLLQATFGVNETHLRWAVELGPWTKNAMKHQKWWYDQHENHLYQRKEDGWRRWRKASGRTRNRAYTPTDDHTSPPPHSVVAIVTESSKRNKAYLEGVDNTEKRAETQETEESERPSPANLKEQMHHISCTLQWALEKVEMPADDGAEIAQKIAKHNLKVICDGSLKEEFGTSAGFPLEIPEENKYRVYNRIPGDATNQSSYRSELCGILAQILMILAITRLQGIHKGTVTMGCDNEPALWAAFGSQPPTAGDSSFDLINVIRYQLKQSQITWKYVHVKGHQDETKSQTELDDWARANIEADRMAKEYWQRKYQSKRARPRPSRMPGEGWRLHIGNRIITQKVDEAIYHQSYYKRMEEYWTRKGRIAEGMMGEVDWKLYGETTRIVPWSKVQWTQKHFSGFEANNHMLYKCGQRIDEKCPACNEVEQHTHIVQCKAEEATRKFEQVREGYATWLQRTTSDWMRLANLELLDAYRECRPAEISTLWPEDIQQAAKKQSRMGERAFIEGCVHQDWEKIQEDYILQTQSRRSPRRWMKELIFKNWMISWDMWDHRNGIVHGHSQTKNEQIIAALDAEITDIHQFGSQHRFLPRIARRFFKTPLQDILRKTEYQKRVWKALGNRYLEHDRRRMANNKMAAFMREWIIPGSSEGRQKTKKTNQRHARISGLHRR